MALPETEETLHSDAELLSEAEHLVEEERLLAAARLLEQIQDETLLTDRHRQLLDLANDCRQEIADLIDGDPLGDGWKRQGESHGKYDTLIYYKVDAEQAKLTCRIETPMEQSMLVPLLAVLNEVELYSEWIPKWRMPKMGIRAARRLEQTSRANQILQVVSDVPWPFAPRDVCMRVTAVDEIDHGGYIAVRMHTMHEGVPEPDAGVERIDFEGAFLFRACPPSHPVLARSSTHHEEPLLLVSFKMHLDPHMAGVPMSLINFVTRTVIGSMWTMLLTVAEGVRDGKRSDHQAAIDAKQDFYKWVQLRTSIMLENLPIQTAEKTTKAKETADYEFVAYLQT